MGRRGWIEPMSAHLVVSEGWPIVWEARPLGRWMRAVQCCFLSVQVPPSSVFISVVLKAAWGVGQVGHC